VASIAVRQVLELYPRVFLACHTRHVRDRRSGRKLSARQAGILDHLDETEPTGLVTLAVHMGVTASTMSLAVDRLVRGGYVRRQRDKQDGRCVNLRLTRAGLRVRREKSVLDPKLVASLLGRLSPAERREAIRGLELLARAADEESAGRAADWLRRRAASQRGSS
jgi:DNA-binding MarR family transcriptional regulator